MINLEFKYCAHKVHIFEDLTENELKSITEMTTNRFYKKGEIIFNEGDTVDYLYIVNSGKIKIYKINTEGKEQILYVLSDGDTFGEYSLFKPQKSSFYAQAITDVKLCLLTKSDFYKVISKNPEIAMKILKYLSERLQSLEALLKDLSTEDIESRLKSMILRLAEKDGVNTEKGVEVDIYLSREDIANYLGTTRESISRKLHKLVDEGIIEFISNKHIVIKNIERLREI